MRRMQDGSHQSMIPKTGYRFSDEDHAQTSLALIDPLRNA
jgi:hypothetical protein